MVLASTRVDLNQNPCFRASLREACGRTLDNNRPYVLQTQAAAPNFICSALWAKCPEVLFAWGWKQWTRAHRHASHACPSNVLLFLITFSAVLGTADDVFNIVDKAYQLNTYRGVYEDERFEVKLPVPGELTMDTTMLPPRPVDGKSGRLKGTKRMKRIPSRGEKSASSAFNVRLESSSGTTPTTAAPSQGAPSLSQGAPSLSLGVGGAQVGVISID